MTHQRSGPKTAFDFNSYCLPLDRLSEAISKDRNRGFCSACICVIAERGIHILIVLELVLFDLNFLQPLQAMQPLLIQSENSWRGFFFPQYVSLSVKKLQSHDILNIDETHLFYNFLPDKFLTHPMGKNHRKVCEGEKMISLLFCFHRDGKLFSISTFVFRPFQARILWANYFISE